MLKTVWVREYLLNGKVTNGTGDYAIKKYTRYNPPHTQYQAYAISVSKKRKSWHYYFFSFRRAAEFARTTIQQKKRVNRWPIAFRRNR